MHKDEVWQVYRPDGEPIVGEGWRAALGNPVRTGSDKIVAVAVVIVYRHGANGLEILWQKRSDKVDRFPGEYDTSAGGHINLGERPIAAAVREAREEIGAVATEEEMHFIGMRPLKYQLLSWLYAVDWTGKPDEFLFDDGEVSEVKWVPYAENDEFRMKYAKEPIREDSLHFDLLEWWLEFHGDL